MARRARPFGNLQCDFAKRDVEPVLELEAGDSTARAFLQHVEVFSADNSDEAGKEAGVGEMGYDDQRFLCV
jgi:hypothetical protein